MKKILNRAISVLLIFVISAALGFAASFTWDKIERNEFPLKYVEYVDEASETFGVPKRIIYAIIKCESDFDATAKSSAGAIGLMQIMPSTFEDISRRLGDNYENGMMYDPRTNIRYGTYYLSYLFKLFEDWELVFAAYNAGLSNVYSWLEDPEKLDDEGRLVKIPFPETAKYVDRVNDTQKKYIDLYGEL